MAIYMFLIELKDIKKKENIKHYLIIKTYIFNLVNTTHFWNNLHQERSTRHIRYVQHVTSGTLKLKLFESQII